MSRNVTKNEEVRRMVIRWQFWFLLTFVGFASWTIWESSGAYDRGVQQANANWEWVQKQKIGSLSAFCQEKKIDLGIAGHAKTGIFNEENPLVCASTLEEAQKFYGDRAQLQAKEWSIRVAFSFIGIWLGLILVSALVSRILAKRERLRREAEGE